MGIRHIRSCAGLNAIGEDDTGPRRKTGTGLGRTLETQRTAAISGSALPLSASGSAPPGTIPFPNVRLAIGTGTSSHMSPRQVTSLALSHLSDLGTARAKLMVRLLAPHHEALTESDGRYPPGYRAESFVLSEAAAPAPRRSLRIAAA